MADRGNHYEAAFEAYLRRHRRPYVAVDEGRRSLWRELADVPRPSHAHHTAQQPPTPQPFATPASPDPCQPGHSLKSLDFIVPAANGTRWLVDVKGRRFDAPSPRRPGKSTPAWRNWSTADDLWSLAQWERLFGAPFAGLLVFAYHVEHGHSPLPEDELFCFRDSRYAFVGVRLLHYAAHARTLSPRWRTVAMNGRWFRHLAAPLAELL